MNCENISTKYFILGLSQKNDPGKNSLAGPILDEKLSGWTIFG